MIFLIGFMNTKGLLLMLSKLSRIISIITKVDESTEEVTDAIIPSL